MYTVGSGSDKVQEAPLASLAHFGVNGYKGGTSDFSSDLSLGRRPLSKTDEKSEVPPL